VPTRTLRTPLLLAALASVTACTEGSDASVPPPPPSELDVVSVTVPDASSPHANATVKAVLHDGGGHQWNFLVTREDPTDQTHGEVRLQNEDQTTSYSLVWAPTQVVSHLDAGKGHWGETLTMPEGN